jgi:cysteine desulfurase
MKKHLYLDYNASAPLRPPAQQAMIEAMAIVGNASSTHRFGSEVRKRLELARKVIADFLTVETKQVIFTSSGTEANNLAIKGFKGSVIVSAVEHPSVLKARTDAIICPVDRLGLIDLNVLANLLNQTQRPTLISVMMANNETGVIQPIQEVATLARRYGAQVHCDAVQAVGKIPISLPQLDIDFLSISAHKIGGPQGIGALIMAKELTVEPLLVGGGQERSYRSGTENFLGIIGFAAAIEESKKDNWAHIDYLRNTLENTIKKICPQAKVFAQDAERLANTSCISMPNVDSDIQIMSLDLAGYAVSAGPACSSGKVTSSTVLKAMGVPEQEAETAIRISLGWDTQASEIHDFINAWQQVYTSCNGSAFSEPKQYATA